MTRSPIVQANAPLLHERMLPEINPSRNSSGTNTCKHRELSLFPVNLKYVNSPAHKFVPPSGPMLLNCNRQLRLQEPHQRIHSVPFPRETGATLVEVPTILPRKNTKRRVFVVVPLLRGQAQAKYTWRHQWQNDRTHTQNITIIALTLQVC